MTLRAHGQGLKEFNEQSAWVNLMFKKKMSLKAELMMVELP